MRWKLPLASPRRKIVAEGRYRLFRDIRAILSRRAAYDTKRTLSKHLFRSNLAPFVGYMSQK